MRRSVLLLLAVVLVASCSDSSGPAVQVRGLWRTDSNPGACQVFCYDGLMMNTVHTGPGCDDAWANDPSPTCWPYSVDGDRLTIDGELGQATLDESGQELTISHGSDRYSFHKLADTHVACDLSCANGRTGEQLRP
jgi:hypothetical protein